VASANGISWRKSLSGFGRAGKDMNDKEVENWQIESGIPGVGVSATL